MAEKDIATNVQDSYTAKDLAVLEGLDAVRKRPGMYIGSTDSRGLMHCLWEIIDNSVDESLAGHCKKIEINLESDGSVEVHDDGRGIPVDKEPKTGLTGVEVVLTKLHAGGKFGGGSYAASGGLHGVGASVVNALASRLDAEVDRDGKIYWMSFKRGVAGIFDGDGPKADFCTVKTNDAALVRDLLFDVVDGFHETKVNHTLNIPSRKSCISTINIRCNFSYRTCLCS
ncbi:MAG: hypothetical protein RI916_1047 [Actinomycetota bacterium]